VSAWDEARALVAARDLDARGFHRVLHGYSPGDQAPRFHLDRFGGWWVGTFHADRVDEAALDELAGFLSSSSEGVVWKARNGARDRAPGSVVRGDPRAAERVLVERPAWRFEARLTEPLGAGAWPDAEPLRDELARTSAGKLVLNLFAYTCLFGIAATRGGARGVVNVDISRTWLDWGRRNYALNDLATDARDFVHEDVHRFLRRPARGRVYDAIVVDPPPFYRKEKVRRPSEELLEEVVRGALAYARRDAPATLHVLHCAARVAGDEVRRAVDRALAAAGRRGEVELRSFGVPDLSPRELAPTFKEARVTLAPV
jgi:23S rRNA G2069 N7-methylase RlmK/C1962 C5-methylase RlmI